MTLKISFFLLLTVFVSTGEIHAAGAYRREVSFEWEEITDAKSYDVEIRPAPGGTSTKVLTFKTKSAIWTGRLVPGRYTMSLRSKDYRGVPGEWSPPSEFNVNLDPVKVRYPADQAQIKADQDDEVLQNFAWHPVPGASEYRFELSSDDGKTQIVETLNETNYKVKIPVAKKYTWKVTGLGSNSMQSESPTTMSFVVIGKKITAPIITPPETEFVREINWSRPDKAEKYDLILSRLNPQTQAWENILNQENIESETMSFASEYAGGSYRHQVIAKGHLRIDSDVSNVNFTVIDGARSVSAENTALVRKSIDRFVGWYGVASYLVTQVHYTSLNYDHALPAQTTYNALSGTTRAGLGYFQEGSRWGGLGLVDFSSINTSQGNRNSFSSEVSSVFRADITELSQLRLQGGVFLKEYLVTESDGLTQTVVSYDKAGVVGPHLGLEYWYSLTPAFGFQANIHLYEGLLKTSTPNGQNLDPSLSTQIGMLGSYRFNRKLTGLMGVAHREDKVRYLSSGVDPRSFGKVNQVVIKGTFLNLFAEYNF